jgi:hypothetical protein
MLTVILLAALAGSGFLLYGSRVSVIAKMKADMAKVVSAVEARAAKEGDALKADLSAVLADIKKHL